jgi:hypothetical protein
MQDQSVGPLAFQIDASLYAEYRRQLRLRRNDGGGKTRLISTNSANSS